MAVLCIWLAVTAVMYGVGVVTDNEFLIDLTKVAWVVIFLVSIFSVMMEYLILPSTVPQVTESVF